MIEIIDVVHVCANLRSEELTVESRRFRPRSAVQPGPVSEGERFSFLRFLGRGGSRLRGCFHLWDECFVRYNIIGSHFLAGGTFRNWLQVRVFFQALDFCLEFLDQLAELAHFVRTGSIGLVGRFLCAEWEDTQGSCNHYHYDSHSSFSGGSG